MAMLIAEIVCVSLVVCRLPRLTVLAWRVGSQQWMLESQPGLLEGWYIPDLFIPLFPKTIQCHWRVMGGCKGGVEECCRQCMGGREDFDVEYFPGNWYQCYDKLGDGC